MNLKIYTSIAFAMLLTGMVPADGDPKCTPCGHDACCVVDPTTRKLSPVADQLEAIADAYAKELDACKLQYCSAHYLLALHNSHAPLANRLLSISGEELPLVVTPQGLRESAKRVRARTAVKQ